MQCGRLFNLYTVPRLPLLHREGEVHPYDWTGRVRRGWQNGPAPFSVPVAVRLLWLSTDDLPYSGKLHWGQVTKSAMGSLPIILLSPHLYFLPGILQG